VSTSVRRAAVADEAAAWSIVDEYNNVIDVLVRDDPATFRSYLAGPGAMWLAEVDGALAGCVVMRPLPEVAPGACEAKRLYVRPAYRGARLSAALMDALEAHARAAGYDAVYLDTKDDLVAALSFYDRRGYERIPRYNDNPQATIFMRRSLRPGE
jgi:GNAT superfamily N-acetyltransferase